MRKDVKPPYGLTSFLMWGRSLRGRQALFYEFFVNISEDVCTTPFLSRTPYEGRLSTTLTGTLKTEYRQAITIGEFLRK
jgi:hypothetical protein